MRAFKEAGVDPEHAAAVLDPRRHGQGAGRTLPPWPCPPSPDLLRHLHFTLGLTLADIADRLHFETPELRALMNEADIRLRSE